MKKKLEIFDEKLFALINGKIKSRFLDIVMPRVTNLGGLFFIIIFVVLIYLVNIGESRKIGFQGALTLVLSQGIVYSMKTIFGRERPYNILEDINTFDIFLKDYSFPSGHSSATFALATTIAFYYPYLSVVAFTIASIVAISRIYLGVHYPTDVLAGMFFGTLSAWIVRILPFNI